MPDKFCRKGCGSSCLRCWRNKLKHASPETKRYMKKHTITSIDSNDACNEMFHQIEIDETERKNKNLKKYEAMLKIKVNTR